MTSTNSTALRHDAAYLVTEGYRGGVASCINVDVQILLIVVIARTHRDSKGQTNYKQFQNSFTHLKCIYKNVILNRKSFFYFKV